MRTILIAAMAAMLMPSTPVQTYAQEAAKEELFRITPGPSPESVIKQRAEEQARKAPGIRDYVRGAQELQGGNFASSIDAFGKAIQANDETWEYFQGRGVAYALSNQYPQAKSDLERALQLSPTAPVPAVFLEVIPQIEAGPTNRTIYSAKATDLFGSDISQWSIDLASRKRPEQARQMAAKLAREFGSAFTQGPRWGPILLEQACEFTQQGKYAESLVLIQSTQHLYMNGPLWLYVKGADDAALGHWENAREEYTRVLNERPDLAAAYLGRALAAAHLCEAQRVKIDLAVAGQLDPKGAQEFQAKHGKEIADSLAAAPKETAYDLAVRMVQEAQQGVPLAQLVADARGVTLAANAVRRRADEQYNDGLRRLANLAAADSRSAQRWADLATYVYLQARVRTVWNGPGDKPQDLRNQNPQQYMHERTLAEQYADKALSLDVNNLTAIGTKAWLLHMRGADADSSALTERGLAMAPFYPRLAKLKGVLLSEEAAAEWQAANRLRSPRMFNGPGWWVNIYPSQAELAQAQAYENYSQDLLSRASATEKAAYDKYANTLQGLVALGDYYDGIDDYQQSIAKYEEALKLNPDELGALEGLHDTYAFELHDPGKALEYEVRAIGTMQTTAAPWLKVAWELTGQARWTSARKALDEAMRLDPADSRVYGYNAAIFSWQNNPGDSASYWKCALAMEEARMNLDGQSLLTGTEALTKQDSLMGLMACWGLFRDQMALGQQDAAMENLKLSNDLKIRATLTSSRTDLPFMGLPAPSNPGKDLPASENVPLMMSKANMIIAKQELEKGNLEKAAQHLTMVRKNGYSGNDPQVRTFVENTSYDLYVKLKGRYSMGELQKFFEGQQLHEFDMRDRGVGPH